MKKRKILISMLIILVLLFPYMNTALAVYENVVEKSSSENNTENLIDISVENDSSDMENISANEQENENEIAENNTNVNNVIENNTVDSNTTENIDAIVENKIDNTVVEDNEENTVDNENNENTLEIVEEDKEELEEAKKGIMCLDTIQNNPTYYVPTDKEIEVSGWAISNDEKAH